MHLQLQRLPPSCPDPTTLSAANETNDGADLGWAESGTATLWDIEVVLSGAAATGTPTDAGVTANPFTKTGLTAGTTYDFYVRADCGGGDLSAYVECISPLQLQVQHHVQIQQHWPQQMRPKLQLTFLGQTMPQYHFWDIEVVLSGAAATGTATDAGVTANPFTKSGLTAGTAYDFYVRAGCGSGSTSAYVAPFTFTTLATPACADPTALASANETQTSMLTFLGQTMPQYHFGMLKLFFQEPLQQEQQQTLELQQIHLQNQGLTAGTAYDFYVRADCGSGSTSAHVGHHSLSQHWQHKLVQIQQHWLQQMRHKLQLIYHGQTTPQYHFGILRVVLFRSHCNRNRNRRWSYSKSIYKIRIDSRDSI